MKLRKTMCIALGVTLLAAGGCGDAKTAETKGTEAQTETKAPETVAQTETKETETKETEAQTETQEQETAAPETEGLESDSVETEALETGAADAETESTAEAVEVDLNALKTGDVYSYQGIPWESTKEEIEATLGVTLEEPHIGTEAEGNFSCFAPDPVALQGQKGSLWYEFTDGKLQFTGMAFQATEESPDLTQVKETLMEELEGIYGPHEDENQAQDQGQNISMYRWLNTAEDGSKNTLQVISYSSGEDSGINQIIIAIGYIPPTAE